MFGKNTKTSKASSSKKSKAGSSRTSVPPSDVESLETEKLQKAASGQTKNLFSRMVGTTKSKFTRSASSTSGHHRPDVIDVDAVGSPQRFSSSRPPSVIIDVDAGGNQPSPPRSSMNLSEDSAGMQIEEGLQSSLPPEIIPTTIQQETTPQDTAPQDTAPQDTAPQDTAPQDSNISQLPLFSAEPSNDQRALTFAEFQYTVKILNTRVESIYRLCRFLSDEQRDIMRGVKKLVAIDELSDGFWKIAYRDVAKKLLPVNLYPNPKEYREALEKYLSEHAEDFIETIGRFSWISLFNEKLLSEIRTKCRSRRNDIAASIRSSIFAAFGEDRLERVDGNTASRRIAEWKISEKTRNAHNELFSNRELLSTIGYSVFKQYRGTPLPAMHCAFVLAISDILLNPASSGIKCSDRSVARRVHTFMRAIENNQPVTEETMREIAEKEAEEAERTANQKRRRSHTSEAAEDEDAPETIEEDDDYDVFISGLDQAFP